MVALAALAGMITAASATGTPTVSYYTPGATYDTTTLQVIGDGTSAMEGAAPAKGIALSVMSTASLDPEELTDTSGVRAVFGGDDGPYLWGINTLRTTPTRNGTWSKVRWLATDNHNEVNFRVADGVTTYTVSRYRHIFQRQLSHRIYDYQFDNYVNVCINASYKTYASGGHLYCTVVDRPGVDRTLYRFTTSTRITKVYPAYVAP